MSNVLKRNDNNRMNVVITNFLMKNKFLYCD